MAHRAETISFPHFAPLRTGSRDEVPCRGAGREPRKRGASRRSNRLSSFRTIAYRVKGRSPLPGFGAGAPQARRIAQKRSAFLISHHCVPGQGAKSLAGVRGGSPASAAHRAETIGFPHFAPLRTGSRGEVPCRGAGREPRKRGVSRRNDRIPYSAPLRTGSRGEVPCRGAGREPRKRGVQRVRVLVPHRCGARARGGRMVEAVNIPARIEQEITRHTPYMEHSAGGRPENARRRDAQDCFASCSSWRMRRSSTSGAATE